MTAQPTNSIDSELEDLLYRLLGTQMVDDKGQPLHSEIDKVKQAIKALYSKEIAEAIGKDEPHQFWCDGGGSDTCECGATSNNAFRAELRAKLLPPTKGGK